MAKQFKRANRALKTLHTYLGRVVRDIGRKIRGEAELESVFAHPLMLARRVREQRQHQRGRKIYSLHAPEVELHCMLRLLHPRYPVYIIPRAEGRLVVGATSIEGDDHSAGSVRGVLELLTAAYSVLPALAAARILEFSTQVRPALPDNSPAIRFDRHRNVMHINGLYRHGFLLTPAIVENVMALLSLQEPSSEADCWPCLRDKDSEVILAPVEDEMHACL